MGRLCFALILRQHCDGRQAKAWVDKYTQQCKPCQRVQMIYRRCVVLRQVGSVQLSLTRTYDMEGLNIAASTDDEVHYVYTITNNGLLSLYNIGIKAKTLKENNVAITCEDTGDELVVGSTTGSVEGLAAYPSKGLASAASLRCAATDSVSRAEVR